MFTLSPLPYAYDGLEPVIDNQTMQIHHDKHHQTYVDNLNKTLTDYPDLLNKNIEEILTNLNIVPAVIKQKVINFGGGHANHEFFWKILIPQNLYKDPEGELMQVINTTFGSFVAFQDKFNDCAMGRFGSGWAWLTINHVDKKLEISSTANQDSPLSQGKIPLLTLDVWEHAYYLKYQNRRADFVKAFWSIVNWERVEKLYIDQR